MLKNTILYIFIYVFIFGCSSPLESDVCESPSHIDIDAPSLVLDENGYYNMMFVDGYVQTFTTLSVDIGIEYWPVGWISNREYNIPHMGFDNWVNLVNQTSYSDDEGKAYTVLGVWDFFIGDTIKVYAGYHNECDIHFVDSLEVIIW